MAPQILCVYLTEIVYVDREMNSDLKSSDELVGALSGWYLHINIDVILFISTGQ